jgi:hypothetical protein
MTTNRQHCYEVWASSLLYLTFAVSLVSDFVLQCGYFAAQKSTGDYLTLYAATPFLLYVYYRIRQGTRGAKTLFLTLYAFVLYHLLSGGLPPTSYDAPLKLGSLVVQHALQVVACGFLMLSLRKPSEPIIAPKAT